MSSIFQNKQPLYFLFPFLFFLTVQIAFAQQDNYKVLFQKGTEEPPADFRAGMGHTLFTADEVFEGYYFRLVQFNTIPQKAERQQMESNGLHFLGYVPHHTYMVAVPIGFDWSQMSTDNTRSVFPLKAAQKTAGKLLLEIATSNQSGEQAEVFINYPAIFTIAQIEEACLIHGITVMESSRYNKVLKASIPLDQIIEKAGLPFISYIEMAPGDPIPDDERGRALHRSNMIDTDYPSGYQFNGEGVSVQVRDDGGVGPHIDFQGRVDNSFQGGFPGSHGTRVASTLGGAGNIDPYAKGMADGAFIYGTDYEETFLDVSMDLFFNNEVVITNSSYSNGCNDGYTTNAQTADQQIFDNPSYIHVFSAGNSNGSDCEYGAGDQWGNITGGHKTGKNVITTANINYAGNIANSSSRGPAEDGRIKPDISAQGSVYAALPNNDYTETSGTSFSAPSVAGVLAQLYQAYKTWNGGDNPPSALMKACLLNTANDLGNPGPDFIFGWGHLNAFRAMKTIEENRYFSDDIEDSTQKEHSLQIPAGLDQVRIMVYWSDVPGIPFADKALVNNIDIQLVTPAGDTILPYVLNPTPNAATLNQPATNGVDDLNNVEQVAMEAPAEGNYTLLVNGTEVPFGPQEYFVLWEEVNNDLMVTYPNGGECLSTTVDHTIHWDAFGNNGEFLLEYSTDNGNSWVNIATVGGSVRNYDWSIAANNYSGQALVRVSRDGSTDVSNATFSIMDAPSNLQTTTACPSYLTLTWDEVNGAEGYVIYLLGSQYMDSIGTTTSTTFDMPISNPFVNNWYAVSSIGPDGACSPRTIANNYNDGLLNCILNDDVGIENGNICEGVNYICEPFEDPLTVTINNNGLSTQSDIEIGYILNNGPVVTEMFVGSLAPGESGTHTFTDILNPVNGENTIKAWLTVPVDEAFYNDTINIAFELQFNTITPATIAYTEDFESGTFPPADWQLNNFDAGITWEASSVIGKSGAPTTAAFINNYAYSNYGQMDEMVTVPIDLTDAINPQLTFDVAYCIYANNYEDTLTVELINTCGTSCINDIIYYKFSNDLSTHPASTSSWSPESGNDWRTEIIDLSPYEGNVVLLSFINTTGYGNGLFIDNINVTNGVAPETTVEASSIVPCALEPITFTDNTTGFAINYEWNFGAGAVPLTANTPGPHEVYYAVPGNKTISLTVSGDFGSDTYETNVDVAPLPEPSFTFEAMDNMYAFTNTSLLGDSYQWDFGDGNTSMEENPTHNYTVSGDYTITLEVTNACGTTTTTETVNVIVVSTNEIGEAFQFDLSPNPGTDDVYLLLSGAESPLSEIKLFNSNGQLLRTMEVEAGRQNGKHHMSTADLPAGTYWFTLVFENGLETKRWVKM